VGISKGLVGYQAAFAGKKRICTQSTRILVGPKAAKINRPD
jgi:hypothetical protein